MKKLIIALFLVSFGCFGQKNLAYHSLEVMYIGLNVADLVTTYRLIDGGGYEANPLMSKIIDNKPLTIGIKTLSTLTYLGACHVIRKDKPKLAFALLILGNIGYSAVVYNNYQVSVRLKI